MADRANQLGGVTKAPGNLSVKFHNADSDISHINEALFNEQEVWG